MSSRLPPGSKNWPGASKAPTQCPQCPAVFWQNTHRSGTGGTIGSNVTGAYVLAERAYKCDMGLVVENTPNLKVHLGKKPFISIKMPYAVVTQEGQTGQAYVHLVAFKAMYLL